jgi:hypothetical protein
MVNGLIKKTIQLSIADTLSGIKYNGYLNGKWILFEYDNKTRKRIILMMVLWQKVLMI